MSNWNKISLYKFQQIHAINLKPSLSEMDKLLFSICAVYDLTEFELDNMKLTKASRYMKRIKKIFESKFNPPPFKRIGRYEINFDPGTMRFGQFIELFHYLSNDSVLTAHQVMASISNLPEELNDSEEHQAKAEYFQKQPITKVINTLAFFMDKYKFFLNEYKWLFGTGTEEGAKVDNDPFNKQYGWIYSAKTIADYMNTKLDDAYMLPVREAFGHLAYLKAKAIYDEKQLKKK